MDLHGRKVLVTGGAGFIGSHLVDRLVELESNVTVIDNFSSGKREHISKKAKLIELDIRNYRALKSAVFKVKPEVVFHLAANATTKESAMGWLDPKFDYEVNAIGTLNIFMALVEAGITPRVVYASSGAVYGEAEYIPMDEEHPTIPISPYGVSKLAGEKYALAYQKEYGIPITNMRIFNSYGPRQPRYIMFDILKKLKQDPTKLEVIGTGEQRRDFIYVADTVGAFILAVEKDAIGKTFNIASGVAISVRELVDKILKLLNLKGVTRVQYTGKSWKGDIQKLIPAISRVKRELGFRAKISLDEGLAKLIEWFEKIYGPFPSHLHKAKKWETSL